MNYSTDESTASTTTAQKALQFNLDPMLYGSIAEVGAGQEVARHFFQAGGASGTIAKTSSAYDMRFSDAEYGPDESGRYVTRSRVLRMLKREFDLVIKRVAHIRPPNSRYFAFADTVSAKRYGVDNECHGWLGIRFQHEPEAEPSQITLHVRLLDSSNTGQQAALGTLGVNLIHSTFEYTSDCSQLVDSLTDDLVWGRIEIDYINFEGPGFETVSNQEMNLRLVSSSLGPVAMFDTGGQGVLPADVMHRRTPLILRGTFRPFTNVHADMIRCGKREIAEALNISPEKVVLLCELNIARHLSEGKDEVSDLQARIQMITELGYHAMVTSHLRFFRLGEYFLRHAQRQIGFIMSVNDLYSIFTDHYYDGLEGGILQAMAKLFASDSKLLVYPNLSPEGSMTTVENITVPDHLVYLYRHLVANNRILSMNPRQKNLVPFDPEALAAQIRSGDENWYGAVPALVRERIGELKI